MIITAVDMNYGRTDLEWYILCIVHAFLVGTRGHTTIILGGFPLTLSVVSLTFIARPRYGDS